MAIKNLTRIYEYNTPEMAQKFVDRWQGLVTYWERSGRRVKIVAPMSIIHDIEYADPDTTD